MKPLEFYIINHRQVYKDLTFSPNEAHLKEYIDGGRDDIMDNVDLFCENVRSKNKVSRFDLFKQVDAISDDTIIVIGLYIELLLYWGMKNKIYDLCKFYSLKYKNNKVVVYYNHDDDGAGVFPFIDDFDNLYVLNYNTSKDHKRFITLPFIVDESTIIKDKKYVANFIGYLNHKTRRNITQAFKNKESFFISEKIPYDEYRDIISESCFTLCPRGVGLNSYRFFESMHLNTIPVLFADDVVLPYGGEFDFVRIPEDKTNDYEYIVGILTSIDQTKMLQQINTNRLEKFSFSAIQNEVYKRLIF